MSINLSQHLSLTGLFTLNSALLTYWRILFASFITIRAGLTLSLPSVSSVWNKFCCIWWASFPTSQCLAAIRVTKQLYGILNKPVILNHKASCHKFKKNVVMFQNPNIYKTAIYMYLVCSICVLLIWIN